MKRFSFKLIFISILISLSATGLMTLSQTRSAVAQVSEQKWSDPINLSQSGGANNPVLVVDSDGFSHVLWQDSYTGMVSANNTSGEWSQPITGEFPFDDYLPTLVANENDNIHAFWLTEHYALDYSRIAATNFGTVNVWSGITAISDSALNFAVNVDELGTIHLAYIRAMEGASEPAGLYYTKSTTNGASWTPAVLLYESPYLRTVDQSDANIQISSALQADDSMALYIAWDNLPLRRVYLIKSNDDGLTWGDAIEIDGPRNTFGLSAPFSLEVAAENENVVLAWLVGQRGVSCSQYSRYSNDGGQTWSDNQKIFGQLTAGGCPRDHRLIGYTDSYAVLMTNTQGQIFLAAWDGTSWSDPQLQSTLGSFTDPISLANVDFRCHNTSIYNGQLLVAGCDYSAGHDIWFTQRALGNFEVWFPPPSAWKTPSTIVSSEYDFQSLQAVANGNDEVHVLYLQPTGIFYSFWADEEWIQPTTIINSKFNASDQLVATIDREGLLYIVWTSSQTGELLFSWANSSKATDAGEWASPQPLPSPQTGAQSPDLIVDNTGTIFVIYSIPINEDRGVYLVSSDDRGETWSKPSPIFDAVTEGWEMVEQSKLSYVGTDHLVATWAHTSLTTGPLELYFSGFNAGTEDPENTIIVSKPVIWNDIAGFGESTVHRVWQELDETQPEIWHTYSNDRGQNWEQPFYISSIGEVPSSSDITLDRSGQLHLTYGYVRDHLHIGIKHWIWNGKDWVSDEGIPLGENEQHTVGDIASTITSNDEIFTIFSLSAVDTDYTLMFTKKSINLLGNLLETDSGAQNSAAITPDETNPEQTPTSTATVAADVEVAQAPVPDAVTPQISDQPAQSDDSLMGLILGIGLAFGLVGAAFAIRLLIASRKR